MSVPNILWICTDQQRYDTLGCYGNEFVDTPNIDALANDGVRFEQAFAQSPVCAPSRASFLTGRYPRTTGCRQNGQIINEDERLVTRLLADEDYTCGLAGKLHLAPANPDKETLPRMREQRIDDGYADFHWSHDSSQAWPTNEYYHWLREKGESFDRTPVGDSEYVTTSVPAEHHQTTWCAEKTITFIEESAEFDQPWLFSVNPFDPHHPFDPPAEYLEPYLDRLDDIPLPDYEDGELDTKTPFQQTDHEGAYGGYAGFPAAEMDDEDHRLLRAAYFAMIDLIDDQVGRMLDALAETGQREDTIVIFMSDHGEMLGDHGIYLKGPYFYEPAVRVPLIISGPGIQSNETSSALVELTDLAPTLLDAAGSSPHPGMHGKSLWDHLTGNRPLDTHRDSIYAEYYNAMAWHDNPELPYGTMVRTDRYKLVNTHRIPGGELYDLQADPTETKNLWDDPEYTDVKVDLLSTMTDRMAETVDPLPERETLW